MISVVRPFNVEVQERKYPCTVVFIHEKPDGGLAYCAIDPDTHGQLFIDADKVTKIIIPK